MANLCKKKNGGQKKYAKWESTLFSGVHSPKGGAGGPKGMTKTKPKEVCGAYLWRSAVFGSCTSDFPEAVPPLAALMVLLAPGFPRGMVARRSVLTGASAAVVVGPH